MPFIWIRVKPQERGGTKVSTQEKIVEVMPKIVSEALSDRGPAGEVLRPDDIEVKIEPFGPMDINTKDIEIIIWAGDNPERRRSLYQKRVSISNKLTAFIIFLTPRFLKPCFPKYFLFFQILGFLESALLPEPAKPLPPLLPAPLCFFILP